MYELYTPLSPNSHISPLCFLELFQAGHFISFSISLLLKLSAGYRILGAGALGSPRGMVWGGRWEGGSGWGTQCVWIDSGSWWWTGRPGMLQSMGREELDATERLNYNWTESLTKTKHLQVSPQCSLMDKETVVALCKQLILHTSCDVECKSSTCDPYFWKPNRNFYFSRILSGISFPLYNNRPHITLKFYFIWFG